MFYPHKVEIQKRDHSQSSDWQAFSAAPVAAKVESEGDSSEGFRGYQVQIPWSRSVGEMITGLQHLGYGFRLLWTDPAGISRELDVLSADPPTERLHRNPVLLRCQQALQPAA